MKKALHLFDLDYTLWRTDAKLAVINKKEPKNIIYRIPHEEVSFMKDFYKNYNLKVSYNGYEWFLSEKLWETINKIQKNIKLEDVGITFREFTDSEILENQIYKTEYLLENLTHLKNTPVELGFVTARCEKNKHSKNITVLIDKIEKKLRVGVDKVFFVNDIDNNDSSDVTAFRKAKIILEYLIGFKIKNDRFIDLKQSEYDNITFYDDDMKNIEVVNNLQSMMEAFLSKSESDVKNKIMDRLKNNNLIYKTYYITQNKIEPFYINEYKILPPTHIKMFEKYTKI
jgi:hypothetical protein